MEGTPEHAQWATGARSALLGYLRTRGDLANRSIFLDTITFTLMTEPATGFRHGISATTYRDAAVLAIASRIQARGNVKKTHVLKLKRNVYGQKQAGRVWNQYMNQGMRSIGFTPSKFDPCLYYHNSVICFSLH